MDDDFTPLEQTAWGDLIGMYGRLTRDIDVDLQEHFRITHAEFEVLLRLFWARDHRLRLQDIAARSMLTRSGISRVVERLVQAGFVLREGATEDRRGAYAVLTPAGEQHFRAALRAHIALVRRQFLGLFTEEEQVVMGNFWQRVLRQYQPPPPQDTDEC